MANSDPIQSRWNDLTGFVSDPVRTKWWSRIHDAYSTRHTHNLQHLERMLAAFEQHKDNLRDRYATAFAVFFKNIVYDPHADDNAAKSAQLVREFSSETTFDSESYVVDLIVSSASNSTEAHLTADGEGSDDVHFLIDFDMAGLAADAADYDREAAADRLEWPELDDATYRARRKQILQLFLEVPHVYATRPVREQLEQKARSNLQRELDSIQL